MTNQIDFTQVASAANYAAQGVRRMEPMLQAWGAQQSAIIKETQALSQTLARLAAARTGGNPSLQYIENVPGRRVPYDCMVAIPIGANNTSEVEGSVTINQDGPFVAVARFAFFLSQLSYQYTDPNTGNISTFQGRSYGRWRPVHSAWDLYDGVPRSEVVQAVTFPGNGAPQIISPSNASSFRSMQGDFQIKMENQGFAYPRSNMYIPSAAWTKQINSPFNLGALDFFERGEVITYKVMPTHPNNPSYGNVQSFTGGGGNWPFIQSQYDAVEGISDPVLEDADSDPITRLPAGVLYIGLHGFKIIQPPGAGPY